MEVSQTYPTFRTSPTCPTREGKRGKDNFTGMDRMNRIKKKSSFAEAMEDESQNAEKMQNAGKTREHGNQNLKFKI